MQFRHGGEWGITHCRRLPYDREIVRSSLCIALSFDTLKATVDPLPNLMRISARTSASATILTSIFISLSPLTAFAAQQSFKDVAADHPAFAAVEFAKEKGIFKGYSDGTFKPGKQVLRAEAVKILVATKLTEQEVMAFTKRSFTDVALDAWYRPYAEAAFQKLGIIDGPPSTTVFNGEKPVTQAQTALPAF